MEAVGDHTVVRHFTLCRMKFDSLRVLMLRDGSHYSQRKLVGSCSVIDDSLCGMAASCSLIIGNDDIEPSLFVILRCLTTP